MSDIPYSVRGSVTSVNKLRGFNFDTIGDNEMFKKVDATNVGGTNLISLETADSNVLRMNIDNATIKGLAGHIEAQIVGATKKLHLSSTGDKEDGITITSDGRVGIGVVEPNEVLQIDGTVRIEDNTTQTLTFYDTQGGSTKEHARIEVDENGGGADMIFYTRPSGGNPPTEKLRINKSGDITVSGTINAQVLNAVDNMIVRTETGYKMHFTNYFTYSYSHFLPAYFGARDLGSASYKWRTVYATVTSISSDDRLKINERPITDALKLISNLNYYEYERVQTLDGKDVTGTDRGVIAQQLLNTGISFAVLGGGTEEIEEWDDIGNTTKKTVEVPYSVNYNILLATSMQAIKDLNAIVSNLEERLKLAGI